MICGAFVKDEISKQLSSQSSFKPMRDSFTVKIAKTLHTNLINRVCSGLTINDESRSSWYVYLN